MSSKQFVWPTRASFEHKLCGVLATSSWLLVTVCYLVYTVLQSHQSFKSCLWIIVQIYICSLLLIFERGSTVADEAEWRFLQMYKYTQVGARRCTMTMEKEFKFAF